MVPDVPIHRCKRGKGEEERKDPDQGKRTMKVKTEYKPQQAPQEKESTLLAGQSEWVIIPSKIVNSSPKPQTAENDVPPV